MKNRVQSTTITFGIKGIEDIIGSQKKLKKAMLDIIAAQKEKLKTEKEGTAAYEAQRRYVEALSMEYKRFGKNLNTLQETLEHVNKASGSSLKRAYQSVVKGLNAIDFNKTGQELEDARQKAESYGNALRGVGGRMDSLSTGVQDMTRSIKASTKSYSDLTSYVKNFEKNGRAVAATYKDENAAYEKMGQNATVAKVRLAELDGVTMRLNKSLSQQDLERAASFWKEMSSYSGASSEQVERFGKKYNKAMSLLSGKHQEKLVSPDQFSAREVEGSVKWLEEYMKNARLSADEQSRLNNLIQQGSHYLKTYGDQSKYASGAELYERMNQQLSKHKTISHEALSEQQKYWSAVHEKMAAGSQEYTESYNNLRLINEELARRKSLEVREEGSRAVTAVNSGLIPGSERAMEETLRKISAYRKELSEDETEELKKVSDALIMLNREAREGRDIIANYQGDSEEYWKRIEQGERNADEVLKEHIKNVQEYKKHLTDPKDIKDADEALAGYEKHLTSANLKKYDDFKGDNLKKKSVAELREAYEGLRKEMEKLNPETTEFTDRSMQMREIDERVKELNRDMRKHGTIVSKTTAIVKKHIITWLGFNEVKKLMESVIRNTIELSDLMTNVQKVTFLSTNEIKRLTNGLHQLDTRTSNQSLMEMAEQAGKLGIATKEGADGILEFVTAGQQIVNTLGEIGGAEAITELLKVNDVANMDRQGIERDLLRIGSAILNVGNNSKATYAFVSDFTKRMGATGSVAHLTMPQIMGLGGAFSALGEEVGRSATATQRVMIGMLNNTKAVSQALNMSYKDLDELIQSGKSYEAFIMVLEALERQGVKSMESFFKAIGGRNTMQSRAAITLLAKHISELEYSVSLAERGFQDGTLVTQEFERANSNLAGVIEQIKNELYEMTVTVEHSDGILLRLAHVVLDVVKWFKESKVGFTLFGVGLGYAASKVVLLIKHIRVLRVLFKSLWIDIKSLGVAIGKLGQLLFFSAQRLFGVANAATNARNALNGLKAAMSTNVWGIVAVALGALAGWLASIAFNSDEAAKSIGRLRQAGEDETASLTALYQKLKDVWNIQGERTRRINEFNDKFGVYYGNLLRESSTLGDLERAYLAVTAAILKKNAAELEGTAVQKGLEATQDERAAASGKMDESLSAQSKSLNRGAGLDDESARALSAEIQQSVLGFYMDESRKDKSYAELLKYLHQVYGTDERLQRDTGMAYAGGKKIYKTFLDDTSNVYNPILSAVKEYATALEKAAAVTDAQRKEAAVRAGAARNADVNYANEIAKQVLDNADAPDQQKLSDRDLYYLVEDFKNITSNFNDSDKKSFERFDEVVEAMMTAQAAVVSVVKPWGTGSDMWSEMGGEELAGLVDWFNEVQKGYKSGQNFSLTMMHRPPRGVDVPMSFDRWTKQQQIDWAYENWKAAKKALEDFNYASSTGDFKDFPEEKERKKKAKDEMDASLKELEAYYTKRQMLAEKYLNEGMILEDEYNRYVFANEQEHLKERQNLRKKWLDASHDFLTPGVKQLMSDVDFPAINKYVKEDGKELTESILLDIAKDENSVEKEIRESREKIDKALMDYSHVAKLTNSFLTDLHTAGVLSDDPFKAELNLDPASQRRQMERLSFLMEEARQGYGLTSEKMKIDAESNPVVKQWLDSLSPEALQLLVLRTRQFAEEFEDAVRKETSELTRRLDFMNKQEGNTARWELLRGRASSRSASFSLSDGWGMSGNNTRGQSDLDLAKIAELETELDIAMEKYEQVYILAERNARKKAEAAEQVKLKAEEAEREGRDLEARSLEAEYNTLFAESESAKTAALALEAEAWAEVESASRSAIQAQQEEIGKSIEQVTPYYEDLLSFSEAFGGAIFGSKEDRKAAADELVSSVIKTTGKMLQEWLIYTTTRKYFNQMELANEAAKTLQMEALMHTAKKNALLALGEEALAEEQVKLAQNATDAASAQSKEAAKAGWLGWALGAGLSLMMTMVFSALSAKTKSAISSATGASGGKLATGMLTYAGGRYPVYGDGASVGERVDVRGDDGVVYRAKYQPRLRTGVVSSPHLGIVGEKGAELIVDSPTYRNLKRYRPDVLNTIYGMRALGSRSVDFEGARSRGNAVLMHRGGVRAYADGNVSERIVGGGSGFSGAGEQAVLQALARLNDTLDGMSGGIPAYLNMYGAGGAEEKLDRANRFLRKVGKRS